MPFIRIPEKSWWEVWRFLISKGPISRVSQDFVYFIGEHQLKLLRRKKLPFEIVDAPNGKPPKKKHA